MPEKYSPIRRAAGQTVEEMAEQLRSAPVPAHWRAKNPENVGAMTEAVRAALPALDTQRVPLDDTDAVREHIRRYLMACAAAGRCPLFAGLCAAMGWSRKGVYLYMRQNSASQTTRLLEWFSTVAATALETGGLSNAVNCVSAIFSLKNSNAGYADRSELELTIPFNNDSLSANDAESARRRLLDEVEAEGEENG